MVYFENFEEFQAASREVFGNNPRKARYTCKYKPSKQGSPEVVLKVTDDTSCLKFRTCSHNDLKYIDQFSQLVAIWTTIDSVHGERDLPSDLITAQKKFASEGGSLRHLKHGAEKTNRTQPRKANKRRKDQA